MFLTTYCTRKPPFGFNPNLGGEDVRQDVSPEDYVYTFVASEDEGDD